MLPPQPFQFFRKIERRQNYQIDRVNRLAARTNCFDFLVNRFFATDRHGIAKGMIEVIL